MPLRSRPWWPSPPRSARRAASGSSRRCAARCRSRGGAILPLPLAAGLYGVLLGLGFTTFILTFAVWALAAVSVALGDPALGAVLGLAFGAGRALPVIALAPVADTDRGNAAHAAMAERPAILRGLRVADAVALAACAVAMTTVAPASATTIAAFSASGPSAEGSLVAFQRPGPRRRLPHPPRRDRRSARPRPGARRRPRRLARRQSQIVLARPTRSSRWRATPRRAPARSRSATSGSCGSSSQTQLVVQPRDASRRRASSRPRERRAARPPLARRPDPRLPPRRQGRLRDPAVRPRHRPREAGALRAPRAVLQPIVRRPPHALRALDLHAARSSGSAPRRRRTTATASSIAPRRPRAATPATRRAITATPRATRAASPRRSHRAHRPGVVDTLWTTALGAERGVCDAAAEEEWRDDGDAAQRPALRPAYAVSGANVNWPAGRRRSSSRCGGTNVISIGACGPSR